MEGMRSKTEAFGIRKLDTLPPPQEVAAPVVFRSSPGEKNDKMNSRTQTVEKKWQHSKNPEIFEVRMKECKKVPFHWHWMTFYQFSAVLVLGSPAMGR
jgi:hypothetical protein